MMIPFRTDLPPVAVFQVKRLRAGSVVIHNGVQKTVQGVVLKGYDLHVKFHDEEVHEDDVEAVVERVPVFRRQHSFWKSHRPAVVDLTAMLKEQAVQQ